MQELEYSEEEINDMSLDEKLSFLNSKEVSIVSKNMALTANDDPPSSRNESGNYTITLRTVYESDTADSDSALKVYRIIGSCEYDKNTKYKDIPVCRQTDLFGFAWKSDSTPLFEETVSGVTNCDVFSLWGNKKGTSSSSLGDRFMKECSSSPEGWGMQILLPSNNPKNFYGNFTITGEIRLAIRLSTNILFAYGHSYESGTSMTIGTGLSVNFEGDVDSCSVQKNIKV